MAERKVPVRSENHCLHIETTQGENTEVIYKASPSVRVFVRAGVYVRACAYECV